jgi:fatty acid synthase subunit beta
LAETLNVERVKEMLGDVVKSCFEKAQAQQKAEGYIKLDVDLPPSIPWD